MTAWMLLNYMFPRLSICEFNSFLNAFEAETYLFADNEEREYGGYELHYLFSCLGFCPGNKRANHKADFHLKICIPPLLNTFATAFIILYYFNYLIMSVDSAIVQKKDSKMGTKIKINYIQKYNFENYIIN